MKLFKLKRKSIVQSKMAAWRIFWSLRRWRYHSQGHTLFLHIILIFNTQMHTHMKMLNLKKKQQHCLIQDGRHAAILMVSETALPLEGTVLLQMILILDKQIHIHMMMFKFENRHRRIQDGCLASILVISETLLPLSREIFFSYHFNNFQINCPLPQGCIACKAFQVRKLLRSSIMLSWYR